VIYLLVKQFPICDHIELTLSRFHTRIRDGVISFSVKVNKEASMAHYSYGYSLTFAQVSRQNYEHFGFLISTEGTYIPCQIEYRNFKRLISTRKYKERVKKRQLYPIRRIIPSICTSRFISKLWGIFHDFYHCLKKRTSPPLWKTYVPDYSFYQLARKRSQTVGLLSDLHSLLYASVTLKRTWT